MRRREFITLFGGVAATWPLSVRAQQPKVWRIGVLAPPTPAALSAFRDGMRERGYVEGSNLSIDVRWPQETFEHDPSPVAELINSNVDVIVARATPTVIAVRHATSTIPIVMVVGDPVASGFIASLARPGGNITGLTIITVKLSAKLMELFVELVPGMKRVGVLRNPTNPALSVMLRETEGAVRKLNMQVEVVVDAQTSDEFERAFAQLRAKSVDGVVLLADPTVIEHSQRIAELAQSARLPTAFQRRENVDAGGLLSYGPDLNNEFRQVAFYVDRILKGEKPAELPVMQPTKVELVINLKTAKALGLTVPQIMQMTADEVIQ